MYVRDEKTNLQLWVPVALKQRVVEAAQQDGAPGWQAWVAIVLNKAASGQLRLELREEVNYEG